MARVVYSYARHTMEVRGFTVDDSRIAEGASTFCGLPLVPFSTVQETFTPSENRMLIAMGFVDMNELREKKCMEAYGKGYSFARFVHESVCAHDDVVIEDNCIILEHSSIHPGSQIGQGTFVCGNVNIGHDCTIGPWNWINAGVSIAGGCQVGPGCFFGVNSCLGQGVRLGARNFLAANTLVNRNTRDNEVYLSEPGQPFRLDSKSFLKFGRLSP
ncbi:MAG: acetyltransferase [Verrucomicrobiota bacterium]|nr:acetyltransferase [Verrucomicrobiota bacterium]